VYIGSVKLIRLEIDCTATTASQGKLIYFMNFPCPPIEAALSIFHFSLFFVKKKQLLHKGLMKTKEIAINAES
jgi:hypothetical protein